MKNSGSRIKQFDLSPSSKSGLFVIDMKDGGPDDGHDVETPHRDNHYLLFIGLQGEFRLMLDFKELTIVAPAMLLIFPGQVHQVLSIEKPEGWAVSFDPSLIDDELQQALERNFSNPVITESDHHLQEQVSGLVKLILELQTGAKDAFMTMTMHELLRAALNLTIARLSQLKATDKSKENRGLVIERDFNHLLKQHYKTWKRPAQFAKALSISVPHLNDTIKQLSGLSVSAHIQQKSILEAKRLLYFTNLSVKEVGYEAGYENPVHFSKLFKKVASATPLQFRRQFRG